MQNLTTVHVLHRQAELHKPIHDFRLGKVLTLGLLPPDVIRKVTMLTKLHYNDQDALLDERVLVRYYIRMV